MSSWRIFSSVSTDSLPLNTLIAYSAGSRFTLASATLVGPEDEQADLAAPAANRASQWSRRTLETVVRPIRLSVGRSLAYQSDERDTSLEVQIEIGAVTRRIVCMVVGLCERQIILDPRYCHPLRCWICAGAAGSGTSDILAYGGADAAPGRTKHEGHGSIGAPVDH